MLVTNDMVVYTLEMGRMQEDHLATRMRGSGQALMVTSLATGAPGSDASSRTVADTMMGNLEAKAHVKQVGVACEWWQTAKGRDFGVVMHDGTNELHIVDLSSRSSWCLQLPESTLMTDRVKLAIAVIEPGTDQEDGLLPGVTRVLVVTSRSGYCCCVPLEMGVVGPSAASGEGLQHAADATVAATGEAAVGSGYSYLTAVTSRQVKYSPLIVESSLKSPTLRGLYGKGKLELSGLVQGGKCIQAVEFDPLCGGAPSPIWTASLPKGVSRCSGAVMVGSLTLAIAKQGQKVTAVAVAEAEKGHELRFVGDVHLPNGESLIALAPQDGMRECPLCSTLGIYALSVPEHDTFPEQVTPHQPDAKGQGDDVLPGDVVLQGMQWKGLLRQAHIEHSKGNVEVAIQLALQVCDRPCEASHVSEAMLSESAAGAALHWLVQREVDGSRHAGDSSPCHFLTTCPYYDMNEAARLLVRHDFFHLAVRAGVARGAVREVLEIIAADPSTMGLPMEEAKYLCKEGQGEHLLLACGGGLYETFHAPLQVEIYLSTPSILFARGPYREVRALRLSSLLPHVSLDLLWRVLQQIAEWWRDEKLPSEPEVVPAVTAALEAWLIAVCAGKVQRSEQCLGSPQLLPPVHTKASLAEQSDASQASPSRLLSSRAVQVEVDDMLEEWAMEPIYGLMKQLHGWYDSVKLFFKATDLQCWALAGYILELHGKPQEAGGVYLRGALSLLGPDLSTEQATRVLWGEEEAWEAVGDDGDLPQEVFEALQEWADWLLPRFLLTVHADMSLRFKASLAAQTLCLWLCYRLPLDPLEQTLTRCMAAPLACKALCTVLLPCLLPPSESHLSTAISSSQADRCRTIPFSATFYLKLTEECSRSRYESCSEAARTSNRHTARLVVGMGEKILPCRGEGLPLPGPGSASSSAPGRIVFSCGHAFSEGDLRVAAALALESKEGTVGSGSLCWTTAILRCREGKLLLPAGAHSYLPLPPTSLPLVPLAIAISPACVVCLTPNLLLGMSTSAWQSARGELRWVLRALNVWPGTSGS
ncbi:unnamed protein product [Chrysoparadoxa australica]